MYDLVGGGFHRYSVDDRWLIPHFEKMLYDNALLARVYLHAWQVTGDDRYREIVEETVEYVLRELALARGRIASAQDADTDGVEGLTHTWTESEAAEHGIPAELLHPFEHGRFVLRGDARPDAARAAAAGARGRPQPVPRRQGDRVVERPAAGRARRGGAACFDRADWLAAAIGVAEFLLGPLSGAERSAAPVVPRRPHERRRVPRRLRERRQRPARAPRRDR